MPTEGHATRITGDCYRLVARLRNHAQAFELNGFTSVPEAQTKLPEFVIAAARMGEVSALFLERRSAPTSQSQTAPDIPGQVVKRWDAELIRRILLQNSTDPQNSTPSDSSVYQFASEPKYELAPAHIPPIEPVAPPIVPDNPVRTDSPPLVELTTQAPPALPSPPSAEVFEARVPANPPAEVRESPKEQTAARSEPAPAKPQKPAPPKPDPLQELADAVTRPVLTGTVLTDLPPDARPRETRPPITRQASNHRRTRWETAMAIAFVAIMAIAILLLDTDGDPLGLFHTRTTTTAPRDSLPLPVRPPTSRTSDGANPTDP